MVIRVSETRCHRVTWRAHRDTEGAAPPPPEPQLQEGWAGPGVDIPTMLPSDANGAGRGPCFWEPRY